MEFSYDADWLGSDEVRPLSLSLPINLDGLPLRGERVGFYFDNLLPDSESMRRRIQSRYQTRSADAFDLLAAVGRDCAGALQLLPEDQLPERILGIEATPLSDAQLERHLSGVVSQNEFGEDVEGDDFRISIAGAQAKTAFTRHRGRWCRPRGATPTTHIFKLPRGLIGNRQDTSLENEWLCAELLAGYGVPMASSEIKHWGSLKALVVPRFDRKLHSSKKYWLRLPQEDLCQATGAPSSRKYEADGGPGLLAIAGLLQGSESRDDDLATLFRAQLLFWMLAVTDGHAKNFSIHLLAQGRFRLTPLYDVVSAWPATGTGQQQFKRTKLKLAMALHDQNQHYRLAEIRRRHFIATAERCGLKRRMGAMITEVVEGTPAVIEKVGAQLPREFPVRLYESVTAGLKRAAREIAALGEE